MRLKRQSRASKKEDLILSRRIVSSPKTNLNKRTCGHCNHSPPKRLWNALESRIFLLLCKKLERAEDEHAHRKKHDEETELLVRVCDGVAQTLKTSGMPTQFKHSENSHQTKNLDKFAKRPVLILLSHRLLLPFDNKVGQVVGHYCKQVYKVESSLEKLSLAGREQKAEQIL